MFFERLLQGKWNLAGFSSSKLGELLLAVNSYALRICPYKTEESLATEQPF
jgi:hypothetical protein